MEPFGTQPTTFQTENSRSSQNFDQILNFFCWLMLNKVFVQIEQNVKFSSSNF